LKKVVIITTGGTIAMKRGPMVGGAVPLLKGDDFMALLPRGGVDLVFEEFSNLPSSHLTPAQALDLGQRVEAALSAPDVDGVVVTYGTDTLEETAYLLDLTINSQKPIVVTGAMRTAQMLGYDGMLNLASSIRVAAAPEVVWDLVTDITLPTRFSPELRAAEWLDGATGVAVGNRFRGHNKHEALGEWATTSHVVECEPERVFAWAVEDPDHPTAIWRFRLAPKDGGTELWQWMQMGPARSGQSLAIDRTPEKEQKIVFVRMREFERNMTITLEQIKQLAEG